MDPSIECVARKKPVTLEFGELYHVESGLYGCAHPLVYLGYGKWISQMAWLFVGMNGQMAHHPRRAGKAQLMSRIHQPIKEG